MVLMSLRAATRLAICGWETQDRKAVGDPCSLGWKFFGAQAACYFGADSNAKGQARRAASRNSPAAEQATCPAEQRAETQELYQAIYAAAQREIAQARRRCRGSSNRSRKEFPNKVLERSGGSAPGLGPASMIPCRDPITVAGAPRLSLLMIR
jgi:hypothetical protein